ncbi:MAG: hypothetical protein IJ806_00775 [Ruminococcus sp.]|nr:hypothetical protein [Ruminococcus sp.]
MADKKKKDPEDLGLDEEDLSYEMQFIEENRKERQRQQEAEEQRKKREREAEHEREKQIARERLELLQLKNGVISEEEATVSERKEPEAVKLTGMKWLENFWYHYKWVVLISVFVVAVVGYITYTEIKRERADLTIMMIANNDLSQRSQELEEFFEKYTDDLDGNGYVHVDVISIPMNPNDDALMQNANSSKFFAQVQAGDAMIVITDSNTEETYMSVMDPTLSEIFPGNKYIDERGFSFDSEVMAQELKYENMPNDVHMSIRYPTATMDFNEKEAKENYDKSFQVYKRIVEDITSRCEETDDPGLETEPIHYSKDKGSISDSTSLESAE